MNAITILGIIAIIIFLLVFIAENSLGCFIDPSPTIKKVDKILGYVLTGAFSVACACGVINLFI